MKEYKGDENLQFLRDFEKRLDAKSLASLIENSGFDDAKKKALLLQYSEIKGSLRQVQDQYTVYLNLRRAPLKAYLLRLQDLLRQAPPMRTDLLNTMKSAVVEGKKIQALDEELMALLSAISSDAVSAQLLDIFMIEEAPADFLAEAYALKHLYDEKSNDAKEISGNAFMPVSLEISAATEALEKNMENLEGVLSAMNSCIAFLGGLVKTVGIVASLT
jgi:hypothetical protein